MRCTKQLATGTGASRPGTVPRRRVCSGVVPPQCCLWAFSHGTWGSPRHSLPRWCSNKQGTGLTHRRGTTSENVWLELVALAHKSTMSEAIGYNSSWCFVLDDTNVCVRGRSIRTDYEQINKTEIRPTKRRANLVDRSHLGKCNCIGFTFTDRPPCCGEGLLP